MTSAVVPISRNSDFALQMGDVNDDRLFSQRVTRARAILADLGVCAEGL
jgi:hypothetical protein